MRSRIRALAALVPVFAVVHGAPARAQAYDPRYPVCMQVYGGSLIGGYIDCSFTSMEQCRASASGRSASCLVNPYAAPAVNRPSGPMPRLRP